MRKFFIIPLLIALGLVISAFYLSGAGILLYFDIPSLIICLIIPLFVLLSHFSFTEMGRAFFVAGNKTDATEEELKLSLIFFKAMEKQFFLAGFCGTFYGSIAMLANISDTSRIGKGLAAALLTIMYSILLTQMVAAPFKNAVEKKLVALKHL